MFSRMIASDGVLDPLAGSPSNGSGVAGKANEMKAMAPHSQLGCKGTEESIRFRMSPLLRPPVRGLWQAFDIKRNRGALWASIVMMVGSIDRPSTDRLSVAA